MTHSRSRTQAARIPKQFNPRVVPLSSNQYVIYATPKPYNLTLIRDAKGVDSFLLAWYNDETEEVEEAPIAKRRGRPVGKKV